MILVKTEKDLNNVQAIVETGLNYAGYVPLVSTLSGAMRINYGKIEVIGAVASAALIAIRAFANDSQAERAEQLNLALSVITTYSLHGIANIFRGILEMVPLLSLATCLPYDLLKHRYAYPREEAQPLVLSSAIPV